MSSCIAIQAILRRSVFIIKNLTDKRKENTSAPLPTNEQTSFKKHACSRHGYYICTRYTQLLEVYDLYTVRSSVGPSKKTRNAIHPLI